MNVQKAGLSPAFDIIGRCGSSFRFRSMSEDDLRKGV